MIMGREVLDLEKHFAFYGAYHSNPINILIHTLFVWPIFYTILVLLYFTPSLCSGDIIGLGLGLGLASHGLFLNAGFFVALTYAVFYVALDRKAGSLAALLCMACWVASSWLAMNLGFSLAWKVVLGAQLLCWTGQFLGHGVFERRAPALLDSFAQSILTAPFFVLLEVLQLVFGYEPYPGFHARVKQAVDAQIKAWKENEHIKLS